ncbi:hypothetical protein [Azospirillum sp. B2RO_4]|uniref:hypothetical protein n=1 Tax=Azospirillum sp. B2RO_4 TaxID=3027796 RepID=UPI003DA994BF
MGSKRFDDVRDFHRHGERIAVFCLRCRRYAEVDAGPLILRPATINRHPSALPWRCSRCRATGKDILVGYDARMQSHRAVP